MFRKILVVVGLLAVVAAVPAVALAAGKADHTAGSQGQVRTEAGVADADGTGNAYGYGPGDGTGLAAAPADGTGYGPGDGSGQCDGTDSGLRHGQDH
jgi:hypothetical protein